MTFDKSIAAQANSGYTLIDLPDDWEIKTLREIAEIDTEFLPSDTPLDFTFNYISLEQVDMGSLTGYSETEFRTAPSRARRVLRYDDVLMSTVRPNLMAHLHYRHQVPNAICSTGFAVIRAKHGMSDPGFIFAHLFGEIVNKQVEQILVGSNYPAITSGDVGSICIPCPPNVPEQRAIAAVLSDIDSLIDALDALIAKKQAVKKATMQQILTGKTRLPGFSGEWESKRLGELFEFRNGLNKAKKFFGSGTPIVNYMDVFKNSGLESADLVGRVTLSSKEIESFNVKRGDVFFTRTSETVEEIGIAAVMLDAPCDTVFSGFVLRARPLNDRLDDHYKRYCFASKSIRSQIVSNATYTTRALTNGKVLSMVKILIPSLREQAAIAAVISDMDAEIEALERRRDKMEAIKQGMMQELLTGNTRLPEAKD